MARKALSLILATGLLMACAAPHKVQGSGVIKEEARQVPAFTAVELAGFTEATIQCQQSQSLKISGDDNLLPLLTSEVHNGVLQIQPKDNLQFDSKKPILVTISVPDLQRVAGAGESAITVSGIKSPQFTASGAGATNFHLSGEAKGLTIEGAGASTFDAEKVTTANAKVDLAGAGEATVNAKDTLKVAITGAGKVTYLGSPKLTQAVTGVGSVEQKKH